MLSPIYLIALGFLLLFYPILSYFYDRKGLRRFPAPAFGFAGISDLWALRYHWTNSRYRAIHEAHQRLGPIVRIQPNHVSFTDPRALKDIYGHGSAIMKAEYYDNIAGDYHDVANATDRLEHARKRRIMSHIFSQKQVLTMEMVIDEVLANFVSAMDKRLGDAIDIRYWFNLFTFDAISSLAFSQPFNFLGSGNDQTFGEDDTGVTYPMNIVQTFHDATTYASFVGHASPALSRFLQVLFTSLRFRGAQALQDFGAMCRYKTNQRLKTGKPTARTDFFSRLEEVPKGQTSPLPHGEQVAEAGIMLNAGSDTTSSGLTNTLWLLATHPPCLTKLRAELDGIIAENDIAPNFNVLMASPYLRACIDESLRLRPPVAIGLPRVTPPQGATICGVYIPGGTTVSAPILELNRHASLFPSPESFDPERWFDEKQVPNLRDYVQPFSTGGRACIGRNLAMIELTKVVATVVMRYEVEVLQQELRMVERFNMNPGECWVRLRRRVG